MMPLRWTGGGCTPSELFKWRTAVSTHRRKEGINALGAMAMATATVLVTVGEGSIREGRAIAATCFWPLISNRRGRKELRKVKIPMARTTTSMANWKYTVC
jgi:hypothetical protein